MSAPLRTLETAAGRVHVFRREADACEAAAGRIAAAVHEAVAARGRAVLGLATGRTPKAVYRHLVEMYQDGDLSFRDVATYNLDEFYPIDPTDARSYRVYMQEHLFAHVDIEAHRAHLFDGTVPEAFAAEHAAAYERWIAADGGLDLQLLGIGRNGHIGFNEPCDLPAAEALALPARVVALAQSTVDDTARDLGGRPELVPRRALTLGVASILAARSILILAFGPAKAAAVARALEPPMTADLPASLLQAARARVDWLVDEAALGAYRAG